jgi:O-methyltransferase
MDNESREPSATPTEALATRIATGHRDQIVSCSTYHPWLLESEFVELCTRIEGHTLVDHMRCFELWSLVRETAKVEGDILEVGVWRGGTGCVMAARAQMIARKGVVFLCDTFRGVVKAGAIDLYGGGEHADTDVGVVTRLLLRENIHNCVVLPGTFPDQTGAFIASRRFSLCHIDVDVYPELWRKCLKNSIDYIYVFAIMPRWATHTSSVV